MRLAGWIMNNDVERKHWYVLLVKTGHEHKSSDEVERFWTGAISKPFVPMKDYYFNHSGGGHWEKVRLFPGYVFVESELNGIEFAVMATPLITRSKHILKLLRYTGKCSGDYAYEMKEEERGFLMRIFNEDYCVEKSMAYFEGDKIKIVKGVFTGYSGSIRGVNFRKRKAVIDADVMGRLTPMTIGLEMVEKF